MSETIIVGKNGSIAKAIVGNFQKAIALKKKTKWIAAMRKALNVILKRAKLYCPEDTRRLVKSGRIIYSSKKMTGRVEFGDKEAWYALIVHEMIGVTFQKSTAIPKFLETAVQETEAEVHAILMGVFS